MNPALSPTAPPAAREGASASQETPFLPAAENAGKPGRPEFTPSYVPPRLHSASSGLGIPTSAYDPNVPGGVGRPYAVGPGLVFDTNVPGGLRKEATSFEDIAAKQGLTDVGISEIQRIGRGIPATGLPGTPGYTGSAGAATATGGPSLATLRGNPLFRALFDAGSEAVSAQFAAARRDLASRASQAGVDTNSPKFSGALASLTAKEGKARADVYMKALLASQTGGQQVPTTGAFADQVNSESDVQRITQEQGATVGGLAAGVLAAKKKARMYSEDIASVQGSAGVFAAAKRRQEEELGAIHERQVQAGEAQDILSSLGITGPRLRTVRDAFNLADRVTAQRREERQGEAAASLSGYRERNLGLRERGLEDTAQYRDRVTQIRERGLTDTEARDRANQELRGRGLDIQERNAENTRRYRDALLSNNDRDFQERTREFGVRREDADKDRQLVRERLDDLKRHEGITEEQAKDRFKQQMAESDREYELKRDEADARRLKEKAAREQDAQQYALQKDRLELARADRERQHSERIQAVLRKLYVDKYKNVKPPPETFEDFAIGQREPAEALIRSIDEAAARFRE